MAHAYASALATYYWGEGAARLFGDAREYLGTVGGYLTLDPPRIDTYIDLSNNFIGREIGAWAAAEGLPDDVLGYLVIDAAREGIDFASPDSGRLFVHPNDPRVPRQADGGPLVEFDPLGFWESPVLGLLPFRPRVPGAPWNEPERFNGYPSDFFWTEREPRWQAPMGAGNRRNWISGELHGERPELEPRYLPRQGLAQPPAIPTRPVLGALLGTIPEVYSGAPVVAASMMRDERFARQSNPAPTAEPPGSLLRSATAPSPRRPFRPDPAFIPSTTYRFIP